MGCSLCDRKGGYGSPLSYVSHPRGTARPSLGNEAVKDLKRKGEFCWRRTQFLRCVPMACMVTEVGFTSLFLLLPTWAVSK